MASDAQFRKKRDKLAHEAGEGSYMRLRDKMWCPVDVSFYPRKQLYITEPGQARRRISAAELASDFLKLQL